MFACFYKMYYNKTEQNICFVPLIYLNLSKYLSKIFYGLFWSMIKRFYAIKKIIYNKKFRAKKPLLLWNIYIFKYF